MKSLTLKSKQINELIFYGVMDMFVKDGFSYKKTKNQFEKIQADHTSIFNFLMTAWSNHFSINIRLYVSQKEIEDVYESVVGKSHKLTIGNTIDRIYASPDGRTVANGDLAINLYSDDDVEAGVESLENYYNTIAKPYFNKYQTLESIDDIINNPPFEYSPANAGLGLGERCMKGLIVARLVDNPNYEKLLDIYDDAIKRTMNEDSIENYYKVREFLMYNGIKK